MHEKAISDHLHLFFCRSTREDARRRGQMNPSYRPSHRSEALVWSEGGFWHVQLTEAGGRKATAEGTRLERAIEVAETKLYGW